MKIRIVDYNPTSLNLVEHATAVIPTPQAVDMRRWYHISDFQKEEDIASICEVLGIDILHIEDILNFYSLSKIEESDDYHFLVSKIAMIKGESSVIDSFHFAMAIHKNWVVTFEEKESDVFKNIQQRLNDPSRRIRKFGTDYLAWAILDVITDHSLECIDALEIKLEGYEERVMEGKKMPHLVDIHRTRREIAKVFHVVRPFREIAAYLSRNDLPIVTNKSSRFFRDLYDHSIQAVELTEFLREHASSLRELYYTTNANRMNEVMKILTGFSAIFLPLTFITSLYGMNFKHMPELEWRWSYPILIVVLITIAIAMFTYFRKRRWI